MRVAIAALTLTISAAAAFALDFHVAELTTYSGSLPCADCVGLRYLLSLRPDGRFYRQRTYLHAENSGQTVLDFGSWSANSAVLTLVSTTQEREAFSVSPAGALLLLDRESNRSACAGNSELNCALTREPRAYVPPGSYRIRGIYNETGGHRTLQPCGSSVPLPSETSGQRLLLQRLSQAVSGGKPALVTVTALFERSGTSPFGESLRIASVLTAVPGGVCPSAVAVPSIVAGLQPDFSSQTKPSADPSAQIVGSSWVLTELDRASPPAGAGEGEASLRFPQEGRISGFTGCNRFNGSYTLAGHSIHLGPVMTTRMACPASANIEVSYKKALADARQIDLEGDSLYLLNEAGRRVAAFRAVHHP